MLAKLRRRKNVQPGSSLTPQTGIIALTLTALARGSKDSFRVCEYSVQRNHIHLIVEADHTVALSRGMQGLVARMAKAVNRAMHRKGAVFSDHYHAHELRKPGGRGLLSVGEAPRAQFMFD